MINVGIIGYGKMGRIRHQVISSMRNAQVDLIYDPANPTKRIFNFCPLPLIMIVSTCWRNWAPRFLRFHQGKSPTCPIYVTWVEWANWSSCLPAWPPLMKFVSPCGLVCHHYYFLQKDFFSNTDIQFCFATFSQS